MGIYEAYLHAQIQVTNFLHSAAGILAYVAACGLLRIASLVVKAWGNPYSYTSYTSLGGRSLSKTKNSEAGQRPTPQLLILKR